MSKTEKYTEVPSKIEYPEMIAYNGILKMMVEDLQKITGHSVNFVRTHLSNVLNKFGCTTPRGNSFNRQIIEDHTKRPSV